MSLYPNRSSKKDHWGGGDRFVKAIEDFGNETKRYQKIVQAADSAETALILGLEQEPGHESFHDIDAKNKVKKLIFRINDCDQRKGTTHVDKKFCDAINKSREKRCTGVVFVSHWMKNYYEKLSIWPQDIPTTVLINGVDSKLFYPRIKINNNKIQIVCHSWSDNKLKGEDYINFLDEFVGNNPTFEFTFIGRTKINLKHTRHIRPNVIDINGIKHSEIGNWLSGDIYVNATRHDPGPNVILEAIASGLPTYVHKDGGGAVEFAGKDHTFSSENELKSILLSQSFFPNDFQIKNWHDTIQSLFDWIDRL